MRDTVQSPFTRITSHIEQFMRLVGKDDSKSFFESSIAVEVVESEPRLLHLTWQARQAFVNRRPRAKHFEPFGFAVEQSLFQMKHTEVIDVVVKVHIDLHGSVVLQKPAHLGTDKLIIVAAEHRTDTQRRLYQYFYGIFREVRLFGYLGNGQTAVGIDKLL